MSELTPHLRSPAFLLYADDFYAGSAALTRDEIGAFMLLLCQQWTRKGLPESPAVLARLARGKVTEAVLEKFPLGPDGQRRNARLERVRAQHENYISNQSRAGKESARRRADARNANRQRDTQPDGNAVATPLPSGCQPDGNAVPTGHSTRTQVPDPDPDPDTKEPTSQASQGSLVPSETDVLAFCEAFPGAPVHGIPPVIPKAWALNWMSWRMEPGKTPLGDWRGSLVRRFKAEFAERRPLALGSMPGSPSGAAAPKKGADLPAWRKQDEARTAWRSSPLNPDAPDYVGDELMTPTLRGKAAELAEAAGQ
jgi:uncharacterized protein YdaU (DUF1376 family)